MVPREMLGFPAESSRLLKKSAGSMALLFSKENANKVVDRAAELRET